MTPRRELHPLVTRIPRHAAPSVLLLAMSAATACFESSSGPWPDDIRASHSSRADGEVEMLTSAQLSTAGPDLSLYDALHRLRPNLLHWRDPAGSKPDGALPVVYIDGRRIGDAQRLRDLSNERVRKVQIVPRDEATRRFGSGHEAGAILVSLMPVRR
jgi:hypothetical protein